MSGFRDSMNWWLVMDKSTWLNWPKVYRYVLLRRIAKIATKFLPNQNLQLEIIWLSVRDRAICWRPSKKQGFIFYVWAILRAIECRLYCWWLRDLLSACWCDTLARCSDLCSELLSRFGGWYLQYELYWRTHSVALSNTGLPKLNSC